MPRILNWGPHGTGMDWTVGRSRSFGRREEAIRHARTYRVPPIIEVTWYVPRNPSISARVKGPMPAHQAMTEVRHG